MARDAFVIAQLSDLHCGSPYFDGDLLETAVKETVALNPDLVVIGGDLTAEGYAGEFRTAQHFLEPLFAAELKTLVIPGNHDSKNVGYLHFRDTFGPGDIPEKMRLVLARQAPLRRLGRPEDVAEAVAFLASAQADYITGETLRINGGQIML